MTSSDESTSPKLPGTCDTCPREFPGSVSFAIALGWGYTTAKTYGGQEVTYVACPNCRGTARKKVRTVSTIEDVPLF